MRISAIFHLADLENYWELFYEILGHCNEILYVYFGKDTGAIFKFLDEFFLLKVSAFSFKRFTSPSFLKFLLSLSIHLLPRMNVMLDFI